MTLYQHHLLGLALTSISMCGFGLFLLLRNPSRPLNRSMAYYCFSIAWWSGWECAALQMPTREMGFLLMRVEYIGVCFIPTLFYRTVSHLLNFPPKLRKLSFLPLMICSTITLFVATLYPTKQFFWISPGPVFYLPFWGWAGPYYWIFLTFFIGTILTGHILLLTAWYRAEGQERIRLALFTIGSLLSYLGGCPEFGLKYGVRSGWLNPFGLYAFPVYIALLTYAVVQHRFFEIQIVIRKSLIYSLLVTLLTAGYFGLVYAVEQISRATFGYQSIWLSLVAFALITMAFQPLKVGIQRGVDWLLFRAPHEELVKRMERLEQEALHSEKLKAVSTLAAGMAHEIKNPLTAIKTYGEYLPEKCHDPEFIKRFTQILHEETSRIQGIVQEVLTFAKPKPPQIKLVDIGCVISSTVDLLSNEMIHRRIRWTVDCRHNGSTIQADSDQLRQVIINLIQNATDAMPQGGTLSIATQANNDHLEMTISDTGEGISKKLLPKIFDPFVTTKPNGTGLGLAMVYSIVQAHHGTICAESQPGHGTTFTLRLPL